MASSSSSAAPPPSSNSSIRAHYEIAGAVEHLYDVTVMERTILTTVTEDPEAVTEWINGVIDDNSNNSSVRYIGVEAELYVDEDNDTRIGTFQMCDGKKCLIFQLVNCDNEDCPPTLDIFLEDDSFAFVGIEVLSKMRMLGDLFSFNPEVQCMELGEIAVERYQRSELQYAEQSELALLTLGVKVAKPEVDHTQWGYPGRLSHEQVHYACLDAFINFQIGRWLARSNI